MFSDTAFMYVIAVLSSLKIYQFRHPDVSATSSAAFGVLAFSVLIGVIGVMESNIYFWIIFGAIHVVTCLILSAHIYYMGQWSLGLLLLFLYLP